MTFNKELAISLNETKIELLNLTFDKINTRMSKFDNLYEAGFYVQQNRGSPFVYKFRVENEVVYIGKSTGYANANTNRIYQYLIAATSHRDEIRNRDFVNFLREFHFQVKVEILLCDTDEIARNIEMYLIRHTKGDLFNLHHRLDYTSPNKGRKWNGQSSKPV